MKIGEQAIWKNFQAFHLKHGGVHKRALEILEQEGRSAALTDAEVSNNFYLPF